MMIEDSPAICSVCQNQKSDYLFSNRPLHQGREITLLICQDCVEDAADHLDHPSSMGALCSWCGGAEYHARFPAGYRFCRRCIDLCREIAQGD